MSRHRETTDTITRDEWMISAMNGTTTELPTPGQGRSVASEGLRAGVMAANGVALAFLAGDALNAEPLSTPASLGMGLAHALGFTAMGSSSTAAAIGYTVIHYGAFIITAMALALVARRARRDSSVLAGALLIVCVAELAFAGLLAILRQTTYTGAITWPQLAMGNLLGWAILGWAMWRMHPELGAELHTAMHGTGAWPAR